MGNIALIVVKIIAAIFLFWSGAVLYKKKENKSIKLWGLGLALWSISIILDIITFQQIIFFEDTITTALFIGMRFVLGAAFILMLLRGTLYLLLSESQTNLLTVIYGIVVLIIDFTFNFPRGQLNDNIATHAIYVTMPLSIVLFSYFYTYYLKLKSKNILFLSISWGLFFVTKLMHIMANSLAITFLENIFIGFGAVLGVSISFSFIYVRKVEKTWKEITRPKSYVIDKNFLDFMNREFQTDTKDMIAKELSKNNVTSIYELGPKAIDIFLENLITTNFSNTDPKKKGYVKTKIIDMLGLKLPPIFEMEEKDNAYHSKDINEFYDNFSNIGTDPEKIISALSKIDVSNYDREEFILFLRNHGLSDQEMNLILESLQKISQENRTIETLKENIQPRKDQGMSDEQIKNYFIQSGQDKEIVDKAFKKFYKASFYTNYLPNIVEHMKNFVLLGKNDEEIISIFLQHGWPRETLEDALDLTKEKIEKEQSSALLENTILQRLVPGIKKEYILKALSKKEWPEDELIKHNPDIDSAMAKFGEVLDSIKLDEYVTNMIKHSLLEKNWPDEIVNMAIKNVSESINFHKTLRDSRIKSSQMVDSGKNSTDVRNFLMSQGLSVDNTTRIINKINKDLATSGQKDKIRSFNSQFFTSVKRKKPSYIDGFMKEFESKSLSADELKQKEEKIFSEDYKPE